eukprot:gene24600-29719_t
MKGEDVEAWARSFGGTALLGVISALLLAGKLTHHICQRRGLLFGVLVVPPVLISGILGLIFLITLDHIDPIMAGDVRVGLESLRRNLVAFVFAAFALGLMSTKSHSLHTSSLRALVVSILHEGMPMMIYSQVLLWGQTIGGKTASEDALFPTMITLGAEAGQDVAALSGYEGDWLHTALSAESLALVVVNIIGVTLFTLKPYLLKHNYLGAQYARDLRMHTVKDGKAEVFNRRSSLALKRTVSHGDVHVLDDRDSPRHVIHHTGNRFADPEPPKAHPQPQAISTDFASLGTHISLISLSVFISFAISLVLRVLEIRWEIRYPLFSGMRLFKVTMCVAVLYMLALAKFSHIRFNQDWFMRLCGLLLEWIVVAALGKTYPPLTTLNSGAGSSHFFMCALLVLTCATWNLLCLGFLAPNLFPNYWFDRALPLTGDSMGRAYTGLLFVRVLDPGMESPVPAAFAAKLMLFFIPTSGAKTAIVDGLVRGGGIGVTLVVCSLVVVVWVVIGLSYFRHPRDLAKMEKDEGASVNVSTTGETDENGESTPLVGGNANASTLSNRSGKYRPSILSIDDGDVATSNRCSVPSSILTVKQMEAITMMLPPPQRTKQWVLSYSLREHGSLLSTLLSNTLAHKDVPCLIVIEDSWGYVFGGYVASGLQEKKSYYGSGESFVYSVIPTLQAYKWTQKNNFFVLSHAEGLAMGGGGEGFAFQVDDELDTGVSNHSDTFDNPTLSSNEFFKCLNVEVWVLDMVEGVTV